MADLPTSSTSKQGYKGFGSFHSENVEEMLCHAQFQPPPLPFTVEDLLPTQQETDAFVVGAEAKSRYFLLDEHWTFINHGAFGCPLKVGLEVANRWRAHAARQPVRFVDRELFPHIVGCIREFAPYIGASPHDVVFLPNVTTGLNTVIKSAGITAGDEVYMLTIGYGSVKKMLAQACQVVGATLHEAELIFPVSGDDDIINLVKRTLKPHTRLAVFDHITSNTALVLPIEKLIRVCHERGVPVLIDGAHALGSRPLNLSDLNVDYYVSNCHKWFSCPPGCAFLYVNSKKRNEVLPLIISHGFGAGYTSNFIWDGYRDYSSILAITSVLKFWQILGPEKVYAYNSGLIKWAVAMLREKWENNNNNNKNNNEEFSSNELDHGIAPDSMFGTMALVAVPNGMAESQQRREATSTDAKILQDRLHFEHSIEVPIKCIQNRLFVRISAHIYNEKRDYLRLADAILQIQRQPTSAESKTI